MAFEALISSIPQVSGAVFHLEGSSFSITYTNNQLNVNFNDVAIGILVVIFFIAIIPSIITTKGGNGHQTKVKNDVENPPIPEESNDITSECLVYIVFRAKQNMLARSIRKFIDLPKFEHWALGFQFTPGKLILVEMSNQNMKVIPKYIPETNRSYLECQFDYVKELDCVRTSPRKIREIVVGHPDNNTSYKWVTNTVELAINPLFVTVSVALDN